MPIEEIIDKLKWIAKHSIHKVGEPPYCMSIDEGVAVLEAVEILARQIGQGWISVKDGLPKEHDSIFANFTHLSKHMWAKESDNVIVYVRFPDGTGRSTEGRLQDGKWWTRISPTLKPVVTHWQPFPEPPKEETP